MDRPVRIGNAHGFWGDRLDAAAELLQQEPDLDYLTLDFLAEVSMSLLALQQSRKPQAGFPQDFVEVIRSLAPYWSGDGRCRVIANAGGLNPAGCARACAEALQNCCTRSLTVAVVSGDDVLALVRDAPDELDELLRNMDTGQSIGEVAGRLCTANAYLGAGPIVEALAGGADIVITGRVADPSLTVAACRHHFQWAEDNWRSLAGATVAGHLIECGAQVTGGIATDWLQLPHPDSIGFPIVEVQQDGSCVVTKPAGTGGRVTRHTVAEQLVYEIGDPAEYLSPDVRVSLLGLQLEEAGADRVRVTGASGQAPPPTLKVSATCQDGFRAEGWLLVIGLDAVAKAQQAAAAVLARLRGQGCQFREAVVECIGAGDVVAHQSEPPQDLTETAVRIAVAADDRDAVERFARELMSLITAGPPGTTGYSQGRPRVRPVFSYWPCLLPRERVDPQVDFLQAAAAPAGSAASVLPPKSAARSAPEQQFQPPASGKKLYDIALARSGDKGRHANIGVVARDEADYPRLKRLLTSKRVAEYFRREPDSVVRYELPNLHALNFVLHGVLDSSLRGDAQGKALGPVLLAMELPEE